MILSGNEAVAVSSLGWVDHGSLWTVDTASLTPVQTRVGDYDFVRILAGDSERFVARAQVRGGGFVISVRRFVTPDAVLAEIGVHAGSCESRGDVAAWAGLPFAFAGYDPVGSDSLFSLVHLDASGSGTAGPLRWFNSESYDLDYQSVLDPVGIPDRDLVLVPIQRSSEPVIYSPVQREVVGQISLAGRHGNPALRFLHDDLWADDYDTLLQLDADEWSVKNSTLLQPAAADGSGAFIGDWVFTHDGSRCIVARPFSGDVLSLATENLQVQERAVVGKQPLEAVALSDGRVIARDWQTGDWLAGRLTRADA